MANYYDGTQSLQAGVIHLEDQKDAQIIVCVDKSMWSPHLSMKQAYVAKDGEFIIETGTIRDYGKSYLLSAHSLANCEVIIKRSNATYTSVLVNAIPTHDKFYLPTTKGGLTYSTGHKRKGE